MTSRLRRGLLAALGAAAIIAAPLIVASPAAAADLTGSTPLFFSNPAFTDADEEDVRRWQLRSPMPARSSRSSTAAMARMSPGTPRSPGGQCWCSPEMENAQFYTVGASSAVSDAAALAIRRLSTPVVVVVSADPWLTPWVSTSSPGRGGLHRAEHLRVRREPVAVARADRRTAGDGFELGCDRPVQHARARHGVPFDLWHASGEPGDAVPLRFGVPDGASTTGTPVRNLNTQAPGMDSSIKNPFSRHKIIKHVMIRFR